MFSNVKYPRFSGTSVPRDFVEYPSQVNEMWATWPEILEELREALQDRRADAAGAARQGPGRGKIQSGLQDDGISGGLTARPGVASTDSRQVPTDALAFEADALKKAGVDFPPVPPRYRDLFLARLRRRLLRRLLLLSLERSARRRQRGMDQAARRLEARERRSLPRHAALARRNR